MIATFNSMISNLFTQVSATQVHSKIHSVFSFIILGSSTLWPKRILRILLALEVHKGILPTTS